MKRLFIISILLIAFGLQAITALSQQSAQSTCPKMPQICYNEFASVPGEIIRANIHEISLTNTPLSFRRAILIFHWENYPIDWSDSKNVLHKAGWQWVLKAQAPFCYAFANCYTEYKPQIDDPLIMYLVWGATFDNNNHITFGFVDYPTS